MRPIDMDLKDGDFIAGEKCNLAAKVMVNEDGELQIRNPIGGLGARILIKDIEGDEWFKLVREEN